MPTRSSAGPMRSAPRAPCGGEYLEVLAPAQMPVEPGLVDDGPDSGQRQVAVLRDGVSEDGHRSGIGMGQSQQHPDERGLAGAVGTEVPERTSPGDKKLHIVDSDFSPNRLVSPWVSTAHWLSEGRLSARSWSVAVWSLASLISELLTYVALASQTESISSPW